MGMKRAYLVEYSIITRVLVDVEDEELNDIEEELKVISAAEDNIRYSISDYLCSDNIASIELDVQCPYGTLKQDND